MTTFRRTAHRLAWLLVLFAPLAGAALPRQARVPGGLAIVPLAKSDRAMPQARFRDQPVLVVAHDGRWQAIVGLPLDLEPGPQSLLVNDGANERRIDIAVGRKHYPEQRLTVKDQGQVDLTPENEARVAGEHAEIQRLKNSWHPTAAVDLDFRLPASGPLSGRFGARRVFNGQSRAPHVGLDIAVPRGRDVRAVAAGTVLAVGDYFFNGKTVFVDHGGGLITMLGHLDRVDVQAGESVRGGQRIGLSGASGRATGPHVHWSVMVNGAMVDPELFLPTPRGRSVAGRNQAGRSPHQKFSSSRK